MSAVPKTPAWPMNLVAVRAAGVWELDFAADGVTVTVLRSLTESLPHAINAAATTARERLAAALNYNQA